MKFISSLRFALLGLATLALTSAAHAQPPAQSGLAASTWPMYQHDERHTGQSPLAGIPTHPLIGWTLHLPGLINGYAPGFSQASDGTVYVSCQARLWAIDPQLGTIKWSFAGLAFADNTSAVGADGTIYWGFEDQFVALSPSGTAQWALSGLSGNLAFGSSPTIGGDGTVYVTHDGLFSYAPNGHLNWVRYFGNYTHSSPAIGPDGSIYVGSYTGKLYAFSPNGDLQWERNILTAGSSASVAADGTIYIGSNTGRVYAYNPDGSLRWTFVTDEAIYDGSSIYAPPAIAADGTLYFGTFVSADITDYAGLYAVTPDGKLKWRLPIYRHGQFLLGTVTAITLDADGNVFACAENGLCYGISPDGVVLWSSIVDPLGYMRSAPLIASDGQIILLASEATVISLKPSTNTVYLPLVATAHKP